MKGYLRYGLLVFFFLVLVPSGLMAEDFLSQADALYKQGGLENIKASIDLYLKAVEKSPNDFDANWKCARAHREYGDKAKEKGLEGWKKICAKYGKEGLKYAKKAMDLDPDKVQGHYYYGLSVGIYSDGVSILRAIAEGLKDKTQGGFEKAYEIDKTYNEAGPILAIGRFWAVLPWPLRDRKKALTFYREYQKTEYFAKKDEGKIYLAELLLALKGKENRAEAKALLEKTAQSDDAYFSSWAERLLKELK